MIYSTALSAPARRLLPWLLAVAFCLPAACRADGFVFPGLNLSIPDGQASGVADFETISSPIHQIGSVEVSLNIAGNFNGDLYLYLQHGSALSVLLNRPGRTSSNPDGYADSGFSITLNNTAANGDIHLYQNILTPANGSPLTGLWQPDGRFVDPTNVVASDPRTATLSVFNNLDPNGSWTLFAADLSAGGVSVLNNWQLTINPVPEPSTAAMVLLGAALFVRRRTGQPYQRSRLNPIGPAQRCPNATCRIG